MKLRTGSILSVATLAIIVVAAFAIIGSGDTPLPADVKFKPRHLDGVNMATVRAEIRMYIWEPDPDSGNLTEIPAMDRIDPGTVVLENWVTPIPGGVWVEWKGPQPKRLVAMFPGSSVKSAIIAILDHMAIIPDQPWLPIEVSLTVSGNLYAEYGGTPWAGTGTVKVTFSDVMPNPNP